MKTAINIEKCIKRHVLGKTGLFFVSTLPGMEHLCVEELKSVGISTENATLSKEDITLFPQQLFVRAVNDQLTVSIDSSGDMLYKRGLKIQGGKAPIRETTAASILALAGYHIGEPLIDPMCGTGTFSLEGAMIANHIPAGWYRNFAFMGWPCFKPSRWKHIRREAKGRITRLTKPVIFASDTEL